MITIILFLLIGVLFFFIWIINAVLKEIQVDFRRVGNSLNEIEERLLALEYPDEKETTKPKKHHVQ